MKSWRVSLLWWLLRAGRASYPLVSLRLARLSFEAMGELFSMMARGPVMKLKVGQVDAEVLEKRFSPGARIIFYLHGGAFVSGSARTHRHLVGRIAREANASAIVINYRLAPEFPFPAALEDAFFAYQWVCGQNIQASRMALVGDSAGGCLAVALIQRLIKENLPLPACLCLLSPWVDLTCSLPSYETRARLDPMISRELAMERARWYAGGKDLADPEVSPLRGEFHGFPPVLILVGSHEVLHDDAVQLTRKLSQAGRNVSLEIWRGMFHVWPYVFPLLPEGRQALTRVGSFIRSHLA